MNPDRIKIWLTPVLLIFVLAGTVDIYQDLQQGSTDLHAILEMITILCSLVALSLLWIRVQKRLKHDQTQIAKMHAQLKAFQTRHRDLMLAMRDAIQMQFQSWQFTSAESRIAEQLIRGASIREIAARTNRSQQTIRNQATAIYQKSGMLGRADLAAFFLEDIFQGEDIDDSDDIDDATQ